MEARAIVLIPVFNNEKTIGEVVGRCLDLGLKVVVVDDGSTDSSAEVANKVGATVLSFSKNRGKGAALSSGFSYILKEFPDTNFIVTIDGDGQHDPTDIPRLLDAAKDGKTLVVGSRIRNIQEMPKVRRIANLLVSKFISLFLGIQVSDTQSGFRIFPLKLIKEKKFYQKRYGIETEMLFAARSIGLSILEIPINTVYFSKQPLFLKKDIINLLDIISITIIGGLKQIALNQLRPEKIFVALLLIILFIWQFESSIKSLERASLQGVPIFSKLTPSKNVIDRLAVFEWLRKNTSQESIVFSLRHEGHHIMALANRKAIVSSKVYPSEVKEVSERIRDLARFFFATDENYAHQILKKYQASYLLVPKEKGWLTLCREIFACHFVTVYKDDVARSFRAGDLTPEAKQRTIIGKIFGGADIPFLEKVWDSPWYLLYRVVDSSDSPVCKLNKKEKQEFIDILLGKSKEGSEILNKKCNLAITIWQEGSRRWRGASKKVSLQDGIKKIFSNYLGDIKRSEAIEVIIADPDFPEFSFQNFISIGGIVKEEKHMILDEKRLSWHLKNALEWILSLQGPLGNFRNFIDPDNFDSRDPELQDLALDALGAWTLAEGYAVFKDPRYLTAANKGLSFVESKIQQKNAVRTNALSFSLLARLRLWESTQDSKHLVIAKKHYQNLRALVTKSYLVPERFIIKDEKPTAGESTNIATNVAFWAIAKYHQTTKTPVSEDLKEFARVLHHRFLISHITERTVDIAQIARLANGFKTLSEATEKKEFELYTFQVGKWLSELQLADGSFPENPASTSIDTNSVGRITEGLVFSENKEAAKKALSWLARMQYTKSDELYFVLPEYRASLIGGLRSNPESNLAPIGAASHFILAGLWYLSR